MLADENKFVPTYPDLLIRNRQRRNEYELVLPIFDKIFNDPNFQNLKLVKSVLCIGAGTGDFDLEFIKRCSPNLKTLVAVEANEHCIEAFKKRCSEQFQDKVDCTFHNSLIENWTNSSGKYDLIICFHVFCMVKPEVQLKVIENVFCQWLNGPFGYFAFNTSDDKPIPGKVNISEFKLKYLPQGNAANLTPELNIKSKVHEYGGRIVYSHSYVCDVDFREYDFDILPLYQKICPGITDDVVKQNLKDIVPDGFACLPVNFYIANLQ